MPFIQSLKRKIACFRTVGVGHVWHLTCDCAEDVEVLLSQGDVDINGVIGNFTPMSSLSFSATLFWQPFWVPAGDVISPLEDHQSGGKFSCQ